MIISYKLEYYIIKNILDKISQYEFSEIATKLKIVANDVLVIDLDTDIPYTLTVKQDDTIVFYTEDVDKSDIDKLGDIGIIKNIVELALNLKEDEFFRFKDEEDPEVTIARSRVVKTNVLLIGSGHEFNMVQTLTGDYETDYKSVLQSLMIFQNQYEFPNLSDITIYISPTLFGVIDERLATLPYIVPIEPR